MDDVPYHMAEPDGRMTVKAVVYDEIQSRNKPSFFATPVAWAVADFVEMLVRENGEIDPHRTGMIVASDECSLATIREISRAAARGHVSPLRFAGASPSVVVGLPALLQGARGPALCLTMPPEHALAAMAATIEYWFRHSNVVAVAAVAHFRRGTGGHLLKGAITGAVGRDLKRQVAQLIDPRL
ncbi:MAG: hypothetical protein P8Y48_06575 [Novosphingobium sp.]